MHVKWAHVSRQSPSFFSSLCLSLFLLFFLFSECSTANIASQEPWLPTVSFDIRSGVLMQALFLLLSYLQVSAVQVTLHLHCNWITTWLSILCSYACSLPIATAPPLQHLHRALQEQVTTVEGLAPLNLHLLFVQSSNSCFQFFKCIRY